METGAEGLVNSSLVLWLSCRLTNEGVVQSHGGSELEGRLCGKDKPSKWRGERNGHCGGIFFMGNGVLFAEP